MTIMATRVGQLPAPADPEHSICPRCGTTFDRTGTHLIAGAPCADCRDILRAEGVETVWDARRLPKEPA